MAETGIERKNNRFFPQLVHNKLWMSVSVVILKLEVLAKFPSTNLCPEQGKVIFIDFIDLI